MTRILPSNSVRTVVLAAGFCALGIVAGCGRESWDLLPGQAPVAGQTSSSKAGNDSGGGGSSAAAGRSTGGSAGKTEPGGFGGRMPPVGGAFNQPCLGEGGCPDEEQSPCPINLPACSPCRNRSDCFFIGDANIYCDPELRRCVQCRSDLGCPKGESCNKDTLRCAKTCSSKDGCNLDGQRQFCSQELGVCVSCRDDPDCNGYGQFNAHCASNICTECAENSHCTVTGQVCVNGHCLLQTSH